MKPVLVRTILPAAALCAGLAALAAPTVSRAADYGGAGPSGYVDVAPVAGPAGGGCYAVFHRRRDGRGRAMERAGPEDVPKIRRLRYRNGASLNGRVMSVTTGPGAVIELYKWKRYRNFMMEIGPGSFANLHLPIMDSYRLRCVDARPRPRPRRYGPPPAFK